MAEGRQFRLLLWKDYLIRKRKVVTLAGVVWATMVMMCLYVVRINVDNQDFPTCQFPARALPSAGMVTFLQSFICSVNNECETMDKFQEIPTYEKSKLTQIRKQVSPLLQNETVLEVAAAVPDALKLLATFADVLDHPTMVDISKNGLHVHNLFINPARVRRYIATELNLLGAVAGGVMNASLSLSGVFKGNFDRCNAESVAKLLQIEDDQHLATFVDRLCSLTEKDAERIALDLVKEIDFGKYIQMIGNMYYKLTADAGVTQLADMATAVLRMTRLESYLPPALTAIFQGRQAEFSYFDVALITKLMDQLEPTFGRTKAYKSLRDFTDMLTTGLTFLDKLFAGKSSDSVRETVGTVLTQVGSQMGVREEADMFSKLFNDAVDMFEKASSEDVSVDVFKILAQIMNLVNRFLPDQTKHEVVFFSTLLSKLIESANKVVTINLNIQEMAYDVSLRNPEGVKVLMSLPLAVVRKGFEGLADAERVQIVTSKLNVRGQIFCDSNKLASFFKVSKTEANTLKSQLCTDAWKNYMMDFIKSFGIYDVKDTINELASLVVQETFGKDVSDQLYTIDKDFEVLKNFTQTLVAMKTKEKVKTDWNKLFNVTDDSEFMKIFKERGHLGKQILITVHGALAKEVVKQNAILDYKISPILLDLTTLVAAMREQLAATPASVPRAVRIVYPVFVQTMLKTLLDEEKTYKTLSTPSEDVVCRGVETASTFLDLSAAGDSSEDLIDALCNATLAVEAGLKGDSIFAKAIETVRKSSHGPLEEVNWTLLIDSLKQIYVKLDSEYPYLFAYTSWGMDERQRDVVRVLLDEAKTYWFSLRRLDRSLHMGIKVAFRLLDLIDRAAFNLRGEGWLRLKHALGSAAPLLALLDDILRLVYAIARNETYSSSLPPRTTAALGALLPRAPRLLVDAVNMLVDGDVNLDPIVSLMNAEPPWPCSNASIASVLPLSDQSAVAVAALEQLTCVDSGVSEEWAQLLHDRNITVYNASTWNTTTFGPHVFLTFSDTFSSLAADTALLKTLLRDLVADSSGGLTLAGAWDYATGLFTGTDRNDTLRTLFANMDILLDSISTAPQGSTSALWEHYRACAAAGAAGAGAAGGAGGGCAPAWRAAWRATLQAASVVLYDAAGDLLTYFTEINEPGASLLQMVGFTRGTGLFLLADRLPEFVAALLNSYWDYGFMSQIRRAALTDFWDCEAVVSALSPAVGSGVDADALRRVRPLLCPSLLYWISLPRGENTFLDIVAKPQYTFYTLPAQNLTSSFEAAFNKTTELARLLATLREKNDTEVTEEDTSLTTLQAKLKQTIDTVLNYRLNRTDPAYRLFNEVNKKQFLAAIYLTRITAMVNQLAGAIENLNPLDINKDYSEDETKKLKTEINTIDKIFKRRPNEAIAFHFDLITKVLSSSDGNYDLFKAFDEVCDKNNDSSIDVLNEGPRTKNQICSKQYKVIYGAIQDVLDEDYDEARRSLYNLINSLKDGEEEVADVSKFFNDRKKLTNSLKSSIKYSYDLSLPIYLKYLQSNLQNYNVVLSFLSGGEWWEELRRLYDGPYASSFFDALESSFDVAEDLLTKMDEIHVVRLIRDMNVNDTSWLCRNASLAEYAADRSGALARLQRVACAPRALVFKELPPLVFASQGYDDDLQLSKEINYTSLYLDLSATESRLEAIRDGPSSPQRPGWITDDKIGHLRTVALNLLSNETLIKISFGVLTNVIDAGTLFLNSSQCTICSRLTTWVKQLNLQLYKKQEYDALLCALPRMRDDQIHAALRNDFHWDMAYRELISFRNYTAYELNKALGELAAQVKLHALEDAAAGRTRLADCLARDLPPGAGYVGHASLALQVVARITKLIRAELPHLHEVAGMADVPFFREMAAQIAPALDVYLPLKDYLRNGSSVREELEQFLDKEVVEGLMDGDVNLRVVNNIGDKKSRDKYMRMSGAGWAELCESRDCHPLAAAIDRAVNATLVARDLPKEQTKEFWKFHFITSILQSLEHILNELSRLAARAAVFDVRGVARGELAATIDFVMEIITGDTLDTVYESVHALVLELPAPLREAALPRDLISLTTGLRALETYKLRLANDDVRVPVSSLFISEGLESELGALGINNTNFWSLAAPRLLQGEILLKPIFSWKSGEHISKYVCQLDAVSSVLSAGDVGVVSRDDVSGALAEQLCALPDRDAKRLLRALVAHVNYTYVVDEVTSFLLLKLYSASNLTEAEGRAVTASLPRLAAVLPSLQAPLGEVAASFSEEPLLRDLANFSSVGGLLGSSSFLASAGNMMCGAPFVANVPRLFRSVVAGEDHAKQPDQAQLDVLPTDFCRSLYKDIIGVEGGKIVWSFVKPLLMGRVLYTPPGPLVDRLIHRANSSFAHMARLASIVHSFAATFPAVDQLSAHRGGVGVLSRLLSAPAFRDLRTSLLGSSQMPTVDLEDVFDEFGDLSMAGSLLTKASNLLHCINLDRFHAAAGEDELARQAANLTLVNEFSAGLVFLNSEEQGDAPTNLHYKIRMDIENTPTTSRMKNYFWIPGPEANFLENMRYFRGFVQIQDLVNQAIIAEAREVTARKRRDVQAEAEVDADVENIAVYTQQMPYPCYRKDFFQTSLYESQALIVCFFFSLLFSVAAAVRFIVHDRESGNTMLLHVMGVSLRAHTLSWFASAQLELALTCASVALVLTAGGVLPNTDPSLVFALVFVFGFSVLCFCYMISKLFSKASLAAVCAAIAYLLTFMPFILILSLEAVISKAAKIVICLSMSSSLCYAFLHITRLEAGGGGARWAEVGVAADGDVSIALAAAMMLVDAAIYVAVGWTIERFFGIKSVQTSIRHSLTSGEKAGVSVVGVGARYGRRRALSRVSLELRRGQLTALLGHNGAGKTTLINILTGMLKPSEGHVVIRSEGEGAGGVAAGVGACPQRDVLHEPLTAREHVALYAQLKAGEGVVDVREEVESMLEVLSLGAVSEVPVSRLSGGTRRRLCVALAFVGAPHLVTLDEPTSGVDPTARRDIWSMIMRLKEERTILMTTHHLDEAELLSDQVVIMHKGEVHTVGSPIEIKRSLGDGYKLTVSFPAPGADEPGAHEQGKRLLGAVRTVVKNASLVDINGLNVDVTLPFFDANGLNNDFLQLCLTLEGSQQELGFRSYALECSSLEQVFHNVCQAADQDPPLAPAEYDEGDSSASKSASSSSVRAEGAPLVRGAGPRTGTPLQQLYALLLARYLHYTRNRGLLFSLLVLPSLFVAIAMGFSTIRPPADNEVSLLLHPGLYPNATEFVVPEPSGYSEGVDASFARRVMEQLMAGKSYRNWTAEDTLNCSCSGAMQTCEARAGAAPLPSLLALPDVDTLNDWLVSTQHEYVEKRYIGYTSTTSTGAPTLTAWYNNKGHHALPAALSALHAAALAAAARRPARLATYSHPLKISPEQISKDTVYQHVADAGISALVVLAYALVSAGGAVAAVAARGRGERRLQLLSGVPPAVYCAAALCTDIIVIVINMVITAILMEAFHFPVFVERDNLPAICGLILLYGVACSSLTHVLEKLFTEPSVANMLLFCGNAFLGLGGITVLLILDIISESERTDNARWVLHKVFLLSPPFALGDGLLEIAKNTIQAQVLGRFGMDTYQRPGALLAPHCAALALVAAALLLLNLALEYQAFDFILERWFREELPPAPGDEPADVAAERARVARDHRPLRLRTIGNINAGFVDTEGKDVVDTGLGAGDVAACVGLGKAYRGRAPPALHDLTLGIAPGQCTALLGENGAGKSTTFALLTGEARPSAGAVRLAGRARRATQLCNGLISYCPQNDAVDPLLTVEETLSIYCRLRGISEREEVIGRTLALFELSRARRVRAGALSGGNARKLCAALAFMSRAPLVLLDEPTSGMDPVSRACVSRGVRHALGGARGVLVSTHALGDARALAARVALLRRGRLQALAPLDECLTRFGGGYVVECRVGGAGGARAAWRGVAARAPHARLRVLHTHALHFLLPTKAMVNDKEVTTRPSDIFRLMAELQGACDIEDYTVNQSSLEQMFLSFSDRPGAEAGVQLEPLPSPRALQRDLLTSVTAL